MKRMGFGGMASSIAVLSFVLVGAGAGRASAADEIKLTGCLIRGEGNDAGYLLVNVTGAPAPTASSAPASPGAVGTAGASANVFYWLTDHDDLRTNVGRQVEIEGELKGDIDAGELKIERKDQWTEIEVKADGREMKAQVPNASIVSGPDSDRKVDVLVRRVDVDEVRMLDATCR